MILTLRTDKPESEIGLYDGDKQVAYESWQAHRQLAETIHVKLKDILASKGKALSDVSGIVVYKGPGSFTGLRIGMSVANALAYSQGAPIVAAAGEDWVAEGLKLLQIDPQKQVTPEYGMPATTTTPKK
jgi:tRNA threonylcarbamoyladenosine biosynthesis protein TsaB